MRPHLPLALLAALTLAAACDRPQTSARQETQTGRLVLRDTAAAQLGVARDTLPEVPRADVPLPARQAAAALRDELRGAADSVRFFSDGSGSFVALIPTQAFDGTDPHVLAAFDAAGGRPSRVVLPTFMHVVLYCPADGPAPEAGSGSRDDADGCRHFDPPRADTLDREP
jgi:hypothetical protein